MKGSVIALNPLLTAAEEAPSQTAVQGLWREAMRQSSTLDFAAFPVAAAANQPLQIELTLQPQMGTLSASLRTRESVLHLATVKLGKRSLGTAIDELAFKTRTALGDPVTDSPVPSELAYSNDLAVVTQCEIALASLQDGAFATAARQLAAARRRDGGNPMVLEALANVAVLRNQSTAAIEIATEALALKSRLTKTTQHRLARTLLLARATVDATTARRCDEDLLTLATATKRERPWDPDAQISLGIALNFLGRFREARLVLEPLAERLPQNSTVHYHFGWAALGLGDAKTASREFAAVAAVLPLDALLVPVALARYGCGDHDGLRIWLAGQIDERAASRGDAVHSLRRMQASLALLTHRNADAAEELLRDFSWLLEQPVRFDNRAGEIADSGEVLVRLGYGERLRPMLLTMRQLQSSAALSDAIAYVSAMIDIRATGRPMPEVAESMRIRGATLWGNLLDAFGYYMSGELAAEKTSLTRAFNESSSVLVKAAIQQNLRRVGSTAEADLLHQAICREMLAIDLRRQLQHPLLAPEFAFAWLVE